MRRHNHQRIITYTSAIRTYYLLRLSCFKVMSSTHRLNCIHCSTRHITVCIRAWLRSQCDKSCLTFFCSQSLADREPFKAEVQNFSIHKYIRACSATTEDVQLTKPDCILFVNQAHECRCQGALLMKAEKQSAISRHDLKFVALHRLYDVHSQSQAISHIVCRNFCFEQTRVSRMKRDLK